MQILRTVLEEPPVLLLAENRKKEIQRFKELRKHSRIDYELVIASTQEELKKQLKLKVVDLFILNLNQFPLQKSDLTQLLQLNPLNAHIPVLFITKSENNSDLEDHAAASLVDFLVEPLNELEIRARIRTYLSVVKLQRTLRDEKDELLRMLQSVVPAEVIQRFLEGNIPRPKMVDNVLVMFIDLVNYTKITQTHGSQFSFENLNTIFSAFDRIIEEFELECVKVIGDAYMIAGGVHKPLDYPDLRAVLAAFKMKEFLSFYNERFGQQLWKLRAGLYKGPVMAGLTRTRKMAFDLWGNTVNLASRLESIGTAGMITIGPSAYRITKDMLDTTFIGERIIDNWGKMEVFNVTGWKQANVPQELLDKYQSLNVENLLNELPIVP